MNEYGYPVTGISSANTNLTLTLAARPQGYKIPHYEVSYGATPTGGRLLVAVGGTTVFSTDITAAGPGPRNPYWVFPADVAVVFTVLAGGAGIISRLNVTVI